MVTNSSEYFSTLETAQRLDLLRHLIENSELVPLVRSPEGMGKSLLAERLQQLAPDNWIVCRFEANAALSPVHLLMHIARCIGWADMKGDPMQGLITRFETLREKGTTPVLLVDDAHLLPPTSLITLLRLYEHQLTGNPLVSIVLFANEQIDMLLSTPQLQIMSPQAIQVIDLLPFNREDATAFMQFLLQSEGLPADLRLDDQRLTRLYRETGGVPGLLRQAILNAVSEGENTAPRAPGGRRRLFSIGVPVVILAAVILFFQKEINRLFEPQPLPSITQPESKVSEANIPAVSPVEMPDQHKAEVPVVALADTPLMTETPDIEPSQLSGQAEPVTDIEVQTSPAQTPSQEQPAVSPEIEDIGEALQLDEEPPLPLAVVETEFMTASEPPVTPPVPAGREAVSESPPDTESNTRLKTRQAEDAKQLSAPGAAKEAPLLEPAAVEAFREHALNDPLRRDAWVLERQASHYTLQLLGVEEVAALKAFIRRHGLDDQAFYVETRRNGRPWFPLLWGEFPDKQQAIEAIKRLPGQLHKRDIWPRTYGSLQSSLVK